MESLLANWRPQSPFAFVALWAQVCPSLFQHSGVLSPTMSTARSQKMAQPMKLETSRSWLCSTSCCGRTREYGPGCAWSCCCKKGSYTGCRQHDEECDARVETDTRVWACGTPGCMRFRQYAPTGRTGFPDRARCCQKCEATNCREHDPGCDYTNALRFWAISGPRSRTVSASPAPAVVPVLGVTALSPDFSRRYVGAVSGSSVMSTVDVVEPFSYEAVD